MTSWGSTIERPGHLQQLALAARQRAGELVAHVGQVEALEQLVGPLLDRALLVAPPGPEQRREEPLARSGRWRPASCCRCTVSRASALVSWNVRTMPGAATRWAPARRCRSPSKVQVPALGLSNPVSRLKNVVLPAPLGPIRRGDDAPLDLEVVDVDGGEAAEAPGDAVGHQDRVGLGHARLLGDPVERVDVHLGESGGRRSVIVRLQHRSRAGRRRCPGVGRPSAAPGRQPDQHEADLADLVAVHDARRGCSRWSTAWRSAVSVKAMMPQKIIEPTTGPQMWPCPRG